MFFHFTLFDSHFHFSHKYYTKLMMKKIQTKKCPSKFTKDIAATMYTKKNVM